MGVDERNFILTKSINCCTYILYNQYQKLNFYVDRDTGAILFKFKANKDNEKYYNKYKQAIKNQERLCVDLTRFNKIMHCVKRRTKEFRKYN